MRNLRPGDLGLVDHSVAVHDVAVTIDTVGPPPHVLLLRGRVDITDIDARGRS